MGLSANNDSQTIHECLDAGMDLFEFKPLKIERLREIFEHYHLLK